MTRKDQSGRVDRGTPDVSVVIPCYNAERWVARAIESALGQEGVTVEVVGGSRSAVKIFLTHI